MQNQLHDEGLQHVGTARVAGNNDLPRTLGHAARPRHTRAA